jgi:CIC family chloride channel protein
MDQPRTPDPLSGAPSRAAAKVRAPALAPITWLRARFRASEAWFIALAIVVGVGAGLLAVIQGRLAHGLQELLYGINPDMRLSATDRIAPIDLLWLPVGAWCSACSAT